jgi:hypothetical protein
VGAGKIELSRKLLGFLLESKRYVAVYLKRSQLAQVMAMWCNVHLRFWWKFAF